jgi:LDH2 family malate/lactate/ureidoglycolate dehydrogenase
MPEEDAAIVAEALAWADLRGIRPQGLAKLPTIVARLQAGGNVACPNVEVVRDTPVLTVFDAGHAWGHVAGVRAMRVAIAKAIAAGVGIAVVRNTDSASALGYYAMLAVEEGLIGWAMNNTTPLLPPWGGTTKLLGNQAFALGCPSARHAPLLFDSATSAITWTGIDKLRHCGAQLPDGVALNAAGEPTTDPVEALAGFLLPMGGHRGYGLSLMFEVLTSVLSGGRLGPEVTPLSYLDRPQGVSHFMLAIDPRALMPLERFVERVDELIDRVHASPPAPGVDRVRLPGERGAETAAHRERDGVPFPADDVTELRRLGDGLGVAW